MAIISSYPDDTSVSGTEKALTYQDDNTVKLLKVDDVKTYVNKDPVITGVPKFGTTAGVLTTDASGAVSATPVMAAYSTTGQIDTLIPNAYTTYNTIAGVTRGKRVEITAMISIGDGNSGDTRTGHIRVQCDGVSLDDVRWQTITSRSHILCSYLTAHTPSAGNHTWTLQVKADTGSASAIRMANITVKEMV